jgi:hypothetical protein
VFSLLLSFSVIPIANKLQYLLPFRQWFLRTQHLQRIFAITCEYFALKSFEVSPIHAVLSLSPGRTTLLVL